MCWLGTQRIPRLFCWLAAAAIACSACQSGNTSSQTTTLVALVDDVASCLNPDGSCASATATIEALDNLYDTLIYYPTTDQNGVGIPDYTQFAPRLATSWTQNGLTWTFKIRQGVKSCAGNTLTADDVVWSWARAKSVGDAVPVTWFLGNVSGIFPLAPVLPNATADDKALHGEVTKVDDQTVQFKQMYTNGLFPRVLAIAYLPVFDSTELKKHVTADDPYAEKYTDSVGAAGFGPYCLGPWVPGQSMTMTANSGSYIKPSFTKVVITKIPSDANRLAAIENGQAGLVTELTPKAFQDLGSVSKVAVLSWYNNESVDLTPNFNYPPWNLPGGKLLRQAIADAIPYDSIINQVYFGNAKRYNSLVPPGYIGQKDFPIYNTDLNKAKSLLTQAGFSGGKGLEKYPDGLALTYAVERKAILEPVALQIQTSLAQVGIPITLNPITSVEYATRVLTKKDIQFGLDDHEHPIGPDADYTLQLYFVSNAKGGLSNSINYSSPAIDAAWAQALGMPVGPARDQVLAGAQQTLMDDLPWIPIALFKSQIAVTKGITNWIGDPDTAHNYWGFKTSG
jgi:peptide/nickel transport system substrate-binding protein